MRLTFCGVRGSCPAPGAAFARFGGETSCVAVAHDGEPVSLVLDAGTGIRNVTGLLAGRPFRGDLLLTHLHWDHTTGLPFFAAADRPGAETTVHVPDVDDDAGAHALLDTLLSPPYFPTGMAGLKGEWRVRSIGPGAHRIGSWDVLARRLPHGRGRSLGYRISDGRRTLAYVTDHGPATLDDHHADVLALADGADVLVHDAQHLASEWAAVKHFGHAPHEYVLGLAAACRVGRVVLFHHSPVRTDDEHDRLAEGLPPGATIAREGDTIDV